MFRWTHLVLATMACALAGACGGGSGQQQDAAKIYIVTMVPGWTPVLDTTQLQTRKDELTRYDQYVGTVRQQIDGFVAGIGHPAISQAIEDVYVVADVGWSGALTPEQLEAILNAPEVQEAEEDIEVVYELEPVVVEIAPGSQQLDPGITRVGGSASVVPEGWAWVIDTGIDFDHPDLNVQVDYCRSMFRAGGNASSINDFDGHGTHVAGIIAARDNLIGTVGVTPGANVVGVKIMAANGRAFIRKGISGIDYVAGCARAGDVVNMSFGGEFRWGPERRQNRAVVALARRGVFITVSAGNDARDTGGYSPANVTHPNVFTIGSIDDSDDSYAGSSNFGIHVRFCAPGVGILSLGLDGGTARMSGTSMAAPHVAGILLANVGVITIGGSPSGYPGSTPVPPIAVR